MKKLLKLNQQGIDYCLDVMRKYLGEIRYTEWPKNCFPPAPPPLPPFPQFSNDMFEDSGEFEKPRWRNGKWNPWPEVTPPIGLPMLIEYRTPEMTQVEPFLGVAVFMGNRWESLGDSELPEDANIIQFMNYPDQDGDF